MTDTEKLATLKAMVGDSDTDEVLSTYSPVIITMSAISMT